MQNKHAWSQIHLQLRERNGAQIETSLPFLMEAAMDVVREEAPALFSEAVAGSGLGIWATRCTMGGLAS